MRNGFSPVDLRASGAMVYVSLSSLELVHHQTAYAKGNVFIAGSGKTFIT
jgi:hypothetical protein